MPTIRLPLGRNGLVLYEMRTTQWAFAIRAEPTAAIPATSGMGAPMDLIIRPLTCPLRNSR